jgi:hypothetical protein
MPPRRRTDVDPKKSLNLISRADAARLRGVSSSAVSQACRPGGPLHGALRGRKLDRTHTEFVAWVAEVPVQVVGDLRAATLRKRTAEAEKLEFANELQRGLHVEREYVQTHLLSLIDAVFLRLLRDSSRSVTARTFALAKSGASLEQGITEHRALISAQLAQLKVTAVRLLGEPRKESAP